MSIRKYIKSRKCTGYEPNYHRRTNTNRNDTEVNRGKNYIINIIATILALNFFKLDLASKYIRNMNFLVI